MLHNAYWKCILLQATLQAATRFALHSMHLHFDATVQQNQAAPKYRRCCFQQNREVKAWTWCNPPTTRLGSRHLPLRKGSRHLPCANWENLKAYSLGRCTFSNLAFAFNTVMPELNLIKVKVLWFGNRDKDRRNYKGWQLTRGVNIPCEVLPWAPLSLMSPPLLLLSEITE